VTAAVSTVFEPSTELQLFLQNDRPLSETLIDLLDESEVLYKSVWAASVMVFRVKETFAVKVLANEDNASTEHQSLTYLREHLPGFPVPQPHGLLRFGIYSLLFTSFVPGINLETAWSQLSDSEKQSISAQLNALLSQMRSLPFPDGTTVGGVGGLPCRDIRRTTRVSRKPIINDQEDWVFSGAKTVSPVYTRLLRSLLPTLLVKCVFTHGDIRPANILAQKAEDGSWTIAAIIDWETCGFYPEYWESVKATNILTPREESDWYNYLPDLASPNLYPVQWLVDRLWDRNMENS